MRLKFGWSAMINRSVAALAELFLIVGVVVLMSIGSSPEKPVEQIKLMATADRTEVPEAQCFPYA